MNDMSSVTHANNVSLAGKTTWTFETLDNDRWYPSEEYDTSKKQKFDLEIEIRVQLTRLMRNSNDSIPWKSMSDGGSA